MKYVMLFLFLVLLPFNVIAEVAVQPQIPPFWDEVDCTDDLGELSDANVCHHFNTGSFEWDLMDVESYVCYQSPIVAPLSYVCFVSFTYPPDLECSATFGQVWGDQVGDGITCPLE